MNKRSYICLFLSLLSFALFAQEQDNIDDYDILISSYIFTPLILSTAVGTIFFDDLTEEQYLKTLPFYASVGFSSHYQYLYAKPNPFKPLSSIWGMLVGFEPKLAYSATNTSNALLLSGSVNIGLAILGFPYFNDTITSLSFLALYEYRQDWFYAFDLKQDLSHYYWGLRIARLIASYNKDVTLSKNLFALDFLFEISNKVTPDIKIQLSLGL